MIKILKTRLVVYFLVTCGLMSFIGFTAFGSVEVNTVSPKKTAAPGELVTVVFSVENTGSQATFDLNLDSPSNWVAIGGLAPITVASQAEETVFVTVMTPPSAMAKDYSLTLSSTSQSDPSIEDNATTTVVIKQSAAVEFSLGKKHKRDKPGQSVRFSLVVHNRGNIIDRFQLEAQSSNLWEVSLSSTSVELLPDEETNIEVIVRIPETAKPGTKDWLTVKAVSQSNRDVSTAERFVTTVLPPEPEAVGRTLYSEVPARLETTFDLSNGESEREMDFSMGGLFSPGLEFEFNTPVYELEDIWDAELILDYKENTLEFGSVGVMSGLASITGTGIGITTSGELGDDFDLDLELAKTDTGNGITFDLLTDFMDIGFGVINDTVDGENLSLADYFARVSGNYVSLTGRYGEGQLGTSEGRAYKLKFFNSSNLHSLAGSYYFGGGGFPGSLTDTTGFSVSARLSPSEERLMSVGAQHNYSRDNVADNTNAETTRERSTRITFSTNFDGVANVSASLGAETKESTDLSQIDEEKTTFSFNLRQTMKNWSYFAFYNGNQTNDYAADSNFFNTVVGVDFGLDLDNTFLDFSVSSNRVKNTDTGVIEERSWSTNLGFSYSIKDTRLSGSISRTDSTTGLNLNYTKLRRRGLETNLGLSLTNSVDGYTASITFGFDFNTPVKLAETKGQVEGRAFLDLNDNGSFDSGEGVKDILLKIDGAQAITDETGKFVFPPIWPGEYSFKIGRIPTGLEVQDKLPQFTIKTGERKRFMLPLKEFSVVSGILYNDKNKNGKRDPGELGVSDVKITLNNGVTRKTRTNQNGRYSFEVPGGVYLIRIDENTLPDRFTFTTDSRLSVRIAARKRKRINFGGYQKPRPILFSPTASFNFTPEEPESGELVDFDASKSYDPDGEIEQYNWNFGDGSTKSTGTNKTTHKFSESGTYTVSLTLVDNDGQRGTISKEIVVKSQKESNS